MPIHDMTLVVGLLLMLIGLATALFGDFTIPLRNGSRLSLTGHRATWFGLISGVAALLILFPLAAPYIHNIGPADNLSSYTDVPTPGALLASVVVTVLGFAVCSLFESRASRAHRDKHAEPILPERKLHETDEPLLPIEDISIKEGMAIRLGDDGDLIFNEQEARDESPSV